MIDNLKCLEYEYDYGLINVLRKLLNLCFMGIITNEFRLKIHSNFFTKPRVHFIKTK